MAKAGAVAVINPDYSKDVDFDELAMLNSEFNDCLKTNKGRFDWKDGEHLRALTKALLLRDFKLQLFLPKDRLCPPVPIRWLYVQWIQSLLDSTSANIANNINANYDPSRTVTGLDIGIGASCIYPLLACTSRPKWKMYGIDIDAENYQHAIHNVAANDLNERITLIKTKPEGPLIPLEVLEVKKLEFTMCNPPFFTSSKEAHATFEKEKSPFSTCTGADIEMVTPGGESAYISRMIDESILLKERVQWYTAQPGKFSTLQTLVQKLKDVGCTNWVVSVLQPKGQTVRWVIGWSWGMCRAPDEVGRHASLVGAHILPEPATICIAVPKGQSVVATQGAIKDALSALPLSCEKSQDEESLIIATDEAVWTRASRRKRTREGTSTAAPTLEDAAYVFAITIPGESAEIRVRWVKGADRVVFESFCGVLKTKAIVKAGDGKKDGGETAI